MNIPFDKLDDGAMEIGKHFRHILKLCYEPTAEVVVFLCLTCGQSPDRGLLVGIVSDPETIRRIEQVNGGPLEYMILTAPEAEC
jgi:hypothetical protein